MTSAVLTHPRERDRAGRRHLGFPGHARTADGETTLDALVSSAWEGLTGRLPVSCPACGGEMLPSGEGSGAQGGRCRACGSGLS